MSRVVIGSLLKQFGPTLSAVAAPTLAVNAAGTLATITGATTGTTNTVYVADWPLETFTSEGSRTGNGTVALTLTSGPKLAYVLSTLSGVTNISNLIHFRVPAADTDSVYEKCLDGVRSNILGLALSGIDDADIIVQKFAWNAEKVTPGIFICPVTESNRPVTSARNDVGYGVQVVIVRAANRSLTSGMTTVLKWREQIRILFDGSVRSGTPLLGVDEVHYVQVEPGPVYDWGAFAAMWDIGSLVVRCYCRESMTVT
jgi:hypothetical protein